MDLLLWRHAEAEDSHPDLLRKLTPRGERQARWMADWIKENAPSNLRIVVSPAARCQQTARVLDLPFETEPRLGTNTCVAELLTAVGWDDEVATSVEAEQRAVLAVGHQPTLGQTAASLAGYGAPRELPKGALVWLRRQRDASPAENTYDTPNIALKRVSTAKKNGPKAVFS